MDIRKDILTNATISYTALNLIQEAVNEKNEKKIGIIFFTLSEFVYNKYFKDKDIMYAQKYVFHSLTQTLLNSLITENFERIIIDTLNALTAVFLGEISEK